MFNSPLVRANIMVSLLLLLCSWMNFGFSRIMCYQSQISNPEEPTELECARDACFSAKCEDGTSIYGCLVDSCEFMALQTCYANGHGLFVDGCRLCGDPLCNSPPPPLKCLHNPDLSKPLELEEKNCGRSTKNCYSATCGDGTDVYDCYEGDICEFLDLQTCYANKHGRFSRDGCKVCDTALCNTIPTTTTSTTTTTTEEGEVEYDC